jgi:hypothetical protein
VYSVLPSYSLGFHGCDASVAERVLAGRAHQNDFDWLGEGIYFWENSPARAMQYARELKRKPRKGGPVIKKPAVVGAVIELGYCLNLFDAQFLSLVREAYDDLIAFHQSIGVPPPQNSPARGDLLVRRLDCAVINSLHRAREENQLRAFDTIRSAFAEGGALYPTSGISSKHHIQICVRRRSCLKGYFRPLQEERLPAD